VPIVAAAQSARVLQQLALEWAVVPLFVDEQPSIEAGWVDIIGRVLGHGLAQPGETIVLTGRADVPFGGSTNHVFLHRVDEPEPDRRPRAAGSGHALRRHGRRIRTRAAREAVAGG
jgi:hypothetical protein